VSKYGCTNEAIAILVALLLLQLQWYIHNSSIVKLATYSCFELGIIAAKHGTKVDLNIVPIVHQYRENNIQSILTLKLIL